MSRRSRCWLFGTAVQLSAGVVVLINVVLSRLQQAEADGSGVSEMGLSMVRSDQPARLYAQTIRVSIWAVLGLWLARRLARLLRADRPLTIRGDRHHAGDRWRRGLAG